MIMQIVASTIAGLIFLWIFIVFKWGKLIERKLHKK